MYKIVLLGLLLLLAFQVVAQIEPDTVLLSFVEQVSEEQIAEFRDCDTEFRSGRLQNEGVNLLELEPETACDWLLRFYVLSREANPERERLPMPPEIEATLREAVRLNPLMIGRFETEWYNWQRPILIASPVPNDVAILLIDMNYRYCFEVYCQDWYLHILPDGSDFAISGSIIDADEHIVLENALLDAAYIEALHNAMTNLVPIPNPFNYADCRGYYYDWRVDILFENGVRTQWTNYGLRGAGAETFSLALINGRWYWQAANVFGEALSAILALQPALEMPQSTHAVRCEYEDLYPLTKAYQ